MEISYLCFGFTLSIVEAAYFEKEWNYQDKILFESYTIGSPFTHRSLVDCARYCDRNPICSMFSTDRNVKSCKLYGQVLDSNTAGAQQATGITYYVNTEFEGTICPVEDGYVSLDDVNLCIRVSSDTKLYSDALSQCQSEGARLVVLEEQDKADAVLSLLVDLNMYNSWVFIGAERLAPGSGTYVWLDGQTLTRHWWYPGEPNTLTECYVSIIKGGIADTPCTNLKYYICEIV